MATATFNMYDESVEIPENVGDLASFRDWFHSDDFPEHGRICFLQGNVWVDMSKEQLFTHNQVRTELTIVVGGIVRSERLGRFFSDGSLLTNSDADVSTQPDGTFVSRESLKSDRVRLIPGKAGGFVELEGSPDMVVEIVSDSSVRKDTVTLKAAYAEAGVREYWLIDAREEKIRFDIFRNIDGQFANVKKQAGWLRSPVFGKAFRLVCVDDDRGNPEYRLEVRE